MAGRARARVFLLFRVSRFNRPLAAMGVLGLVVGAFGLQATPATAAGSTWTVSPSPIPQEPEGNLVAVSCPAANACVAVGYGTSNGVTSTLAEAWNGTSWTLDTVPVIAGSQESVLDGISCTSPASCIAVGWYSTNTNSTTQNPLAVQLTGTTWTVMSIPVAPTAADVSLSGVSCSASYACTAVGTYGSNPTASGFAERWNGAAWALQTTPDLLVAGSSQLNSVSCPTATDCEAVGSLYNDVTGQSVTLVEQWAASRWARQISLNAANQTSNILESVSCTSILSCTAVGESGTVYGNTALAEEFVAGIWITQPTQNATTLNLTSVVCTSSTACRAIGNSQAGVATQTWNGVSWKEQPDLPTPTGRQMYFNGLSCSSALACTAVGSNDYYNNDSYFGANFPYTGSPSRTLADHWDGTAWSEQATVAPFDGVSSGLQSVSCTSAVFCMATGTIDDVTVPTSMMSQSWDGTSWTTEFIPLVPDLQSLFRPLEVSCTSADFCMAISSYANSDIPDDLQALADIWNGTTWTRADPPVGNADVLFNNVSCVSPTFCMAVGQTNSNGPFHLLAETWNGSTWTVDPSPVGTFTADPNLGDVSCVSAVDCTAVGSEYIGGYNANNAVSLAEHWDGTSWAVEATPIPPTYDTLNFDGVSCTSATWCVAVGIAYDNSVNHRVTLGEEWNGSAWSQMSTLTTGTYGGGLSSVSCTSATSCTAVGSDGQEGWDGTAWTLQPNSVSQGLYSVSCVEPGGCTAVTAGFANKIEVQGS